MDTNQEKMLEKVRKLLALAEDRAATPAEAEAFSAKAEQLMIDYAIDNAMLAESDPVKADKIIHRSMRLVQPHLKVKAGMLYEIGKCLSVGVAYEITDRNDGQGIYCVMGLIGYEVDVEWVEVLFTSLELQRINALAKSVKNKSQYESGRAFTASFNHAFRTAVINRLKMSRQASVARRDDETTAVPGDVSLKKTSTALVLIAREERVNEEYRARFPYAREKTTTYRYNSASGYRAGNAAGDNAQIARGSVGGARRALQ
jgi:hypothetical protein